MESQGQGMKEIGALLVEGGEIGADGTEGVEACLGAETAGDFLFDLGHANRLLGDIVGEGDVVIGHEAPNIIGMDAQAVDEIERLALAGSAASARRRSARVGGFAVGKNPGMSGAVVRDALRRQRSARRRHLLMRGEQQVDQVFGPGLFHFLEDVGQFAQVMGVAQAMRALQVTVRLPAVVDQRAGERGQNAEGVKGLFAPVHVRADPGQRGRSQDMQPADLAGHAHAGFVGVGNGRILQSFTHGRHRRREQRPRFLMDRQYRGIRQRQAKQVSRQISRARHRHHVMVGQMHDGGPDARSVLHRGRDLGGELAPMPLAAGAARFENMVFGDFVIQRRNVKHLAGLDDGRIGQRAMAGIAVTRRRVGFNVIDFRHFLQGVAGVPLLSACRFLSRLALRFRFGPEPIRGRRFAGVAAVLCQPSFEIGHLGGQGLNLRRQRLHLREQRSDQIIFGSNAQSVKIRQLIHALFYRLPLPFLKPGVAMLFRPT